MRTPRRSLCFGALALAALTFAACSEDSPTVDGGGGDGTPDATTTTEAALGEGSGTLVVGDRTYAFEAQCRITEGEPGSIEADGDGTFEGRDFTIVVKSSPSETSVIETVQLAFSSTESLVGTNFVARSPEGNADTKIKVTGDGTAEGTLALQGSGGQASGDGVLSLTCS